NAAVQKCIPEPICGFLGSPTSTLAGAVHNLWFGNIMFNANGPVKQCGGTTTNAGQRCTTAGNTCAGAAPTCTGTPSGCGGTTTEAGKFCCAGGAPTCASRTNTDYLSVVDNGAAANIFDFMFTSNIVFGTNQTNVYGIDFINSAAAINNETVTVANVSNNVW